MFRKTVKRQGEKIIELDNKLKNNKIETINFLDNTVRELLNLQDVNNLGLEEKEKNKHRNIIINALVENCLEKIYATKFSYFSDIEPGDLLVIYRMGEEGRSKKYGSCITGIAIFEEYKKCSSKEEFLKFCKNITVFSTDELNSFYDNNYKSIVKMIYLKPIQPKIILKELQDKGLIVPGQGPRILEKIDKNKFCKILNEKGILPWTKLLLVFTQNTLKKY